VKVFLGTPKLRSSFVLMMFSVICLQPFLSSSVLAAPLSQEDERKARADALAEEAFSLFESGDFEGAIEKYEEARSIYQEIGDLEGEDGTLNMAGMAYLSLGQYEQALQSLQKSLAITEATENQEAKARTLNNIGLVYHSLGQYGQTLDYYLQALALDRETGDRESEGIALANIGEMYRTLGQYEQAVEHYQQALGFLKEKRDPVWEWDTLHDIGLSYQGLGQYEQALVSLQEARSISQKIGDPVGEAITLDSIGGVYLRLGQYEQALEYYENALALSRQIGDPAGEATRLNNIGEFYRSIGQYEQAFHYYQQALEISEGIGDPTGLALALGNSGEAYRNLGRYEQALEYFLQALAIAQAIGDRTEEARMLNNIGTVHISLEQSQQALDALQQAITILKEMGHREGEETALNNMAGIYLSLGQHEQALDHYTQALAIAQEIGDRLGEASALNNIGHFYSELGQYEEAFDYFRKSLKFSEEIGHRSGKSTVLTNIGFLYKQQGDSANAITYYQQAIAVIESIQSDIKVEDLKSSFASEQIGTYENLIDVLWDEARFQEAFHYVERARARVFLDQLAAGTVDFRAGVDVDLIEREQALRNEIANLQAELFSMRNQPQANWDPKTIAETEAELGARESEYAELIIQIKVQSPEVASLVSVDVASLTEIQSLLDTDSTLLEYFVMEDRTLAFIITAKSFDAVALDVHQNDLRATITSFLDFTSLDDPHPDSLRQLHAWLIAPLKDRLKSPTLGIIPHGILHYLPFSTLTDGSKYMNDEYALFNLPSASVLRFVQQSRKSEVSGLLALGNPTTFLPELEFAEAESQAVAGLYNTKALIRQDATETLLREQAPHTGTIHLAAHGEYNFANPLFSAIYLASDSQNDGRLETHEIYGLDLTAATDLVVLSACQTDVGRVSAGDEVIGLTRAFLYAGTPTVIASLWNVEDKATALLMQQFYTHLRSGMSKGEALQKAQIAVREQFPHPYYWAAFVLTGDPGSIVEVNSMPWLGYSKIQWAIGIIIGFVVLIGGAIFLRKKRKGSHYGKVNELV
jgi:CHAT domain-containing protein/Tfp pilus assembly protein PilF